MDLWTTNSTVVIDVLHAKLGGQASRQYVISVILGQTSILQFDLSHPGLKPLNLGLLLN